MKTNLPNKSCYIEIQSMPELKNLAIVVNSIKSGLINPYDINLPCKLYYNSSGKSISSKPNTKSLDNENYPTYNVQQFIENIIFLEKFVNATINSKICKIKLDSQTELAILKSDSEYAMSLSNFEKIIKFANRSKQHPFKGKFLYLNDHDEWEIAYQFMKKMNWKIDTELIKENSINLAHNLLVLDDPDNLNSSRKNELKKYGEIALPIVSSHKRSVSGAEIDLISFLKLVKSNNLVNTLSVMIGWRNFTVLIEEKTIGIGCKTIDRDDFFMIYNELKEMIDQKGV